MSRHEAFIDDILVLRYYISVYTSYISDFLTTVTTISDFNFNPSKMTHLTIYIDQTRLSNGQLLNILFETLRKLPYITDNTPHPPQASSPRFNFTHFF